MAQRAVQVAAAVLSAMRYRSANGLEHCLLCSVLEDEFISHDLRQLRGCHLRVLSSKKPHPESSRRSSIIGLGRRRLSHTVLL
ncbi:hypothetical protein NM688_g6438 [Phlebia brevispora]|uniref:Uncharacterized protein n=1 Tax=Phlebia brevispora TaxID=194682 RepID=A0ACC1SFZ5_9APHY|nr:hypothetical protein NM688_g6438 [Phlebia brevispora]